MLLLTSWWYICEAHRKLTPCAVAVHRCCAQGGRTTHLEDARTVCRSNYGRCCSLMEGAASLMATHHAWTVALLVSSQLAHRASSAVIVWCWCVPKYSSAVCARGDHRNACAEKRLLHKPFFVQDQRNTVNYVLTRAGERSCPTCEQGDGGSVRITIIARAPQHQGLCGVQWSTRLEAASQAPHVAGAYLCCSCACAASMPHSVIHTLSHSLASSRARSALAL